jgi:hypothetical protein
LSSDVPEELQERKRSFIPSESTPSRDRVEPHDGKKGKTSGDDRAQGVAEASGPTRPLSGGVNPPVDCQDSMGYSGSHSDEEEDDDDSVAFVKTVIDMTMHDDE